MKKEDLIKLGISEELAESVVKIHTEEIDLATKNATEKAEKQAEKTLETEKATLNAEITKLKEANTSDSTKYSELKKKYDEETATLKADRDNLERNYLIESALTSKEARNIKAAKALLDMDKITLKDGKLEGLDSQIETIVKDNGFLFGKAESGATPQFMKSTQNPSGLDGAEGKGLTYSQMMAIRETNPNAEI